MNLSEEKKPLIPYLWGLYTALFPYYVPGHFIEEKIEPDAYNYGAYLDFDPNSVLLGLTKTYIEYEYEGAVSDICKEFDIICKSIAKEIIDADTTPWQVADRMRHAVLTGLFMESLWPDRAYMLSYRPILESVVNFVMEHQEPFLLDLIENLLVIDAKTKQIVKVCDVPGIIKSKRIVIVNIDMKPYGVLFDRDKKEWLRSLKKGVSNVLKIRFKTPDMIVIINGGRIIPALTQWYLEQKGISEIRLVGTGLDEFSLMSSEYLKRPSTWSDYTPDPP